MPIESNEGYISASLVEKIVEEHKTSPVDPLDDLEYLSERNNGVRAIMDAFPIESFRRLNRRMVDYERYCNAIYATLLAVSVSALPGSVEVLDKNYMNADLAAAALTDFMNEPNFRFEELSSSQPGLAYLCNEYESQGFRIKDLSKLKVAIGAAHKLAVAAGLTVGTGSDTPVVELGQDFSVIGQDLQKDFTLSTFKLGLEFGLEQLVRIDYTRPVLRWRRLYYAQEEPDRKFIDRIVSGYQALNIRTAEDAKNASFIDLEPIGLKAATFTKIVFGSNPPPKF